MKFEIAPKNFKIAKTFGIMASLFPISVGTYFYFYFLSKDSFHFIEHIAFTNLVQSGVTMMTLVWFGLKREIESWVLFLLIFNLIWTNGNDTYATIRYYVQTKTFFPFPLFPLILGSIATLVIASGLQNKD